MAAGFKDLLAFLLGWKSSGEVELAKVSERFALTGTDDTRLALDGTKSTRLALTGTDDTRLTLVGTE